MRACLLGLVAVVSVSCKKDPAASRPSVSTAAVDALWALAPADTELGVVASPRGLALLDGGKSQLLATLRGTPDLASLAKQFETAVVDEFGTSDLTAASHGLSVEKGFAMFMGKAGRVLVLPVVDRDKFLATAKGTKGTDTDTFGDLTCKTVKSVYACAKPASLLEGMGAGKGRPVTAQLVAARGDVEIAGTVPGPSAPISFAIIGQLDRGAVVMRVAVKGIASAMPVRLAEGAAPTVDPDHTTGFAVLDLSTWLAGVPPVEVAPGVMADQLARSVAGPATATVRAGIHTIDMRIPLSDPEAAKKLIAQCDQLPPLRALGATVVDGVCHARLPEMMMEVDAWVEGKELRLGQRQATGAPARSQLTPIATELAARKWPLVLWGRGTILAATQMPPIGGQPDLAAAMLRTFTMFNEMGLGMRMDGDTLHAVIAVRTAFANSDDVLAKLQAIPADAILTGRAGDQVKAIAAAAPTSPLAGDLAAGYMGLMIPTAAVGMLAAIVIPAFMDYMKKSKVSESALQLNRLGKYLKSSYAQTARLPVGTAPLTPLKPCCEGPGAKCNDPSAWANQPVWKELDFSIDDAHLFRYDYASTDGKSFVAHAVADLDCDGEVVTYTLSGSPEGDMLKVRITGPEGID